jgi:hypothetical protein
MESVMIINETKIVDSTGVGEAINVPTEKHIESELKEETASTQISDSSSLSQIATNSVSAEINNTESQKSSLANFDSPKPLNPESFPDQPRSGQNQLPATIANIWHLINGYNIKVQYDVIKKKLSIIIPRVSGAPDNADNVAIVRIISLANLNGIPIGQLPSFLEVIGDKYQSNPVADWISSKPWDKTNRMDEIFATLTHRSDFPEDLKKKLIFRWLLSAVAAALKPGGFKAQ